MKKYFCLSLLLGVAFISQNLSLKADSRCCMRDAVSNKAVYYSCFIGNCGPTNLSCVPIGPCPPGTPQRNITHEEFNILQENSKKNKEMQEKTGQSQIKP